MGSGPSSDLTGWVTLGKLLTLLDFSQWPHSENEKVRTDPSKGHCQFSKCWKSAHFWGIAESVLLSQSHRL